MNGRILLAFLLLACCYCHGSFIPVRQEELKEEELWRKGQIERFVAETGKDQMIIYSGSPPIQGFKAVVKYIEGLRANGLVWFNSTTIEEMDLGDYAMHFITCTAYNEKGTLTETGPEMKFYKKVNGKLSLLVDAFVPLGTPWPVKTSSATDKETGACCK